MDYLNANPSALPANLTVTVIPNANPDGVFKVIGKEGRFSIADVPKGDLSAGRFNADRVDLNRNFDCNWSATGTWQNKTVSAGTAAFSEPEAAAIRDFALQQHPTAFVFWHSQANGVYSSECGHGILPQTLAIMNTYAQAAGYPAVKHFDAYVVNGASEDWLATIGIPAITVELSTHESIEWDKNLAGIRALFAYFAK
jgi:predicted deacylase